ncbi:MAG TPA: VanW family protein [Candidatus Paceibacterota bacterium]|nr:VanW family protein [Candidatus Paceibacterota bacterium]
MRRRSILLVIVIATVLVAASAADAWYLDGRIVPHTSIGGVAVGGETREAATATVQDAVDGITQISLDVDGAPQLIDPDSIGFDVDLTAAVDAAYARGHTGSVVRRLWERVSSLWSAHVIPAPVRLDDAALQRQVSDIADLTGVPGRDIRLSVSGSRITVLTDTAPGRSIDQEAAISSIVGSLRDLDRQPIHLSLQDQVPHADPASAPEALKDAQLMTSRALTLQYEDAQFYLSREKLASWLTNTYDGDRLVASLDRDKIATYVTTVATALNVAPVPPQLQTDQGQVTGFTPSKVGRSVQETKLIDLLVATITARTTGGTGLPAQAGDTLTIPVEATQMSPLGLDSASGIRELIGTATTPFTGSPKNRISNIKNGVKFISGAIVKPGEEFSTLGRLGTVDNTTGYLPELVIKGDRTQPEFGGGLCQVSTTLFRAVLNAGLPITMRQNHSYRVSYYEKDGNGNTIGPGLDATIYDPTPDFRFVNDTADPIMIIGYVIGDKVTFELYGTKDGRTSQIIGPKLLTETPSGPPIYIPSTDVPVGVTRQVETPHPGGSAVATYIVTYADGHQVTKVFHSYYRPWPAQYLVGVAALPSPSPSPSPVAVQ